MKILELFCGTKSFSNVARARGHETITVDLLKKHDPTICADVLSLTPEQLKQYGPFDFIWASPPCTLFSWARPNVKVDDYHYTMFFYSFELIKELKPKYWVVENPNSWKSWRLNKDWHSVVIPYHPYGTPYLKPTRFWTNLFFISRFPGNNKDWTSCSRNSEKRGIIPYELCEQFIIAAELNQVI